MTLEALLLAAVLFAPQTTTDQQASHVPATDPKAKQTAPPPSAVSELIKVTIYPSRSEVVPNGSYGIYADLENISAFPVMIVPDQTALVVLPEAAEPSACVNWGAGIFPTESSKLASPSANRHWQNPLIIERGEHYVVFWDLEPAVDSETRKSVSEADKGGRTVNGTCQLPPSWLSSLGFVPGDYTFTVEGNAYALDSSATPASAPPLSPSSSSAPATTSSSTTTSEHPLTSISGDYRLDTLVSRAITGATPTHRFSETKSLRVGISQLTTLLAAMIGAFLAYGVTALKKDGDWDAFMKIAFPAPHSTTPPPSLTQQALAGLSLIRNAVLAAVLGGVVTIVASRLSDTHFPVKVSVNDWWGALSIGFIAYFVGNKFIETLTGLGSGSPSTLGQRNSPTDIHKE